MFLAWTLCRQRGLGWSEGRRPAGSWGHPALRSRQARRQISGILEPAGGSIGPRDPQYLECPGWLMGGNDGATNRLRRDPDADGFLGCWRSARTGPLKPRKQRSGIVRPTPSYGSTHRAQIITSRAIRGTVARSAVFMLARSKPTKMACRHGQIPTSASLCAVPRSAFRVSPTPLQEGMLGPRCLSSAPPVHSSDS